MPWKFLPHSPHWLNPRFCRAQDSHAAYSTRTSALRAGALSYPCSDGGNALAAARLAIVESAAPTRMVPGCVNANPKTERSITLSHRLTPHRCKALAALVPLPRVHLLRCGWERCQHRDASLELGEAAQAGV